MKFLGGVAYCSVVVDDIMSEHNGALLRQTFQNETSPAILSMTCICEQPPYMYKTKAEIKKNDCLQAVSTKNRALDFIRRAIKNELHLRALMDLKNGKNICSDRLIDTKKTIATQSASFLILPAIQFHSPVCLFIFFDTVSDENQNLAVCRTSFIVCYNV